MTYATLFVVALSLPALSIPTAPTDWCFLEAPTDTQAAADWTVLEPAAEPAPEPTQAAKHETDQAAAASTATDATQVQTAAQVEPVRIVIPAPAAGIRYQTVSPCEAGACQPVPMTRRFIRR